MDVEDLYHFLYIKMIIFIDFFVNFILSVDRQTDHMIGAHQFTSFYFNSNQMNMMMMVIIVVHSFSI